AKDYGDSFQRALETASLFGNTVVQIRGHADPCVLVQRFLPAAEGKGVIKKMPGGGYVTTADNKPFDPTDIKQVTKVIDSTPGLEVRDVDGTLTLTRAVQSLQELSDRRSEEVRQTI